MSSISATILAFWIAHGSLGDSPYSFETVPECGSDPEVPACELKPVCANEHDFRCRAPRWSPARGAWVRVETLETAKKRVAALAYVLAETAIYLTDCRHLDGSVDESCDPAGWPRGPGQARTLAYTAATVAMWESGLREDIQGGFPPAGRGPAQEGCVMQIMPNQAGNFADWVPDDSKPKAKDEHEEIIQSMLGFRKESMRKCFSVGMRILARSRRACAGKGFSWDYSTFAMYGSGHACSSSNPFAVKRQRTYRKLIAFDPGEPALRP